MSASTLAIRTSFKRSMTVIAAFSVSNFPVLFGDLLLTGPSVSERRVAVPAQGEVQDFFGDSGWSVLGLTQKVCVLGNDCAIAWAGSWLGARVAIAELRRRYLSGSQTIDDMIAYLKGEPELQKHPASFIGLLHNAGQLHQFHVSADELQCPTLGMVYLSGSGSYAVEEFSRLLQTMDSAVAGGPTAGDEAVSTALSMGGMLLQVEFRGGNAASTLRNMFGGGYEIAFFSGGRMQKLTEVTYVIWEANLDETSVHVSHPLLVIKQKYAGDYLLVRSARIESSPTQATLRIVDEQGHVIRPMFDVPRFDDVASLKSLSLQSRLLCHCILTHGPGSAHGIYTRVQQYGPDSELGVTFEDTGGQVVFGMRNDTMMQIAQSLDRFRL